MLRKIGHFLAYTALFLAYASLALASAADKLKSILLALAICFLVSSADESRQAMHPSRTGSVWDVVLDMSGALTAALVLFRSCGRETRVNPRSFSFFQRNNRLMDLPETFPGTTKLIFIQAYYTNCKKFGPYFSRPLMGEDSGEG